MELYRLPIRRTIDLIEEITPFMEARIRSDAIPSKLLVISKMF